jgi:hypothetical protein
MKYSYISPDMEIIRCFAPLHVFSPNSTTKIVGPTQKSSFFPKEKKTMKSKKLI